MKRTIFVTGTDTGVGKTFVTSLLLRFHRRHGGRALAMKPFCTGDREDVRELQAGQGGEVSDHLVNPFYFSKGVAPAVAARKRGQRITVEATLQAIGRMQSRCDLLLIEGAGGLLAPLGHGLFTAEDLVRRLGCEVVVVARNRLGTLNHTMLVMRVILQVKGVKRCHVVLNQSDDPDISTPDNAATLRRWLAPIRVLELPRVVRRRGRKMGEERWEAGTEKKLKKVLATILH